jgi:hypothetical protein
MALESAREVAAMTPFQYLLVLVSILMSLAIADILTSLHRLLRVRHQIRWHWHPLAAALVVLLAIWEFWWKFYRLGRMEVWSHYTTFLLLMLHLILLFLLACAALPDSAPGTLDLATYYEQNRKYFWTLFALFSFSAVSVNLVAAVQTDPLPTLLFRAVPNLLCAGVMLSLAFVRSKTYHSGCILLLLLVMVLGWWSLGLQ